MDNTDKKILIVDDDETSRSLLRQVLGDCTNIFEAADGVEALAFLERNPDTALVFLDVLMPRMDGMELLLRMRLSPVMREIPVIMLSASPEEDMNYRGLSLGATCFVYKPYRTALLREMADKLLRTPHKEAVIEPGSIEELIFSRSQALDSGLIVLTPTPDGGLRQLWEGVAPRLLKHLLARGKVPGEMLVRSQRLFRMLRPLCLDLPLKLSLRDSIPELDQMQISNRKDTTP